MLPERVDDEFSRWLGALPWPTTIVLHANHANELDASVASACARLRDSGAVLLNQAVLLRGVNDDATGLADLSERLFDCGVLPYYLHQLDRVAGAAHFEVDDARARVLVDELRERDYPAISCRDSCAKSPARRARRRYEPGHAIGGTQARAFR